MNDQPEKKRGRKPRRYPYQGQQLTLAQLSELSGWSTEVIRRRILSGKSAEYAVKTEEPDYKGLVVVYRGEERTLDEWEAATGIPRAKLYARLFHDPVWTKEEAFEDTPRSRPGVTTITIQTPDGPVKKTITQWSRDRGIPSATIHVRRARGWTDAQALEFEPSPSELRRAEQATLEDDDAADEP